MNYNGPRNPNPGPGEAGISIYLYRPWMGGAIAGVVTFGIALVIQLFYMFKRNRRTKWFHGLLALGSVGIKSSYGANKQLMEVGGYAARVKGHANMWLVSVVKRRSYRIALTHR